MELYYSSLSCNLMHGDCRKMLRTLVHILAASVFDMIFGASRKSASFSQKIS